MIAAWRWLEADHRHGHVYLSSDIYRHPTFMLLDEQATVHGYFEQHDPNLSWFDARGALAAPGAAGSPATYLIGPRLHWRRCKRTVMLPKGPPNRFVLAPDGSAALTVIGAQPAGPAAAQPAPEKSRSCRAQPGL